LKLAFYRERWDLVVELFSNASFSRGFSEGRVCVGSSETTSKPFLEILAIALNKLNGETPTQVVSLLENTFGLSASEWQRWRQQPAYCSEQTIKRIQKRCIPKPGRNPPISVEEALSRGNTPRANEVLTYLRECDELIVVAQEALERFGKTGSEDDLGCVIEIVTRSGITPVSHSMLFVVMGHDSYVPRDGLPDRLVRLYSCHPVMNKRHFGKLLDVKFKYGLPLTGAEILTGLFQQRGSLTAMLEGRDKDDFFDIGKLAFFRDWAEIRLDDWIQGRGAEAADAVASTWREGKASPVAHPFGGLVRRPPESPRNMSEWEAMLDAASAWLESRWKREVGTSQWVSENQLYQILKRKLKGIQVLQHVQPMWLSPQHLDVLIPEVCIAVEYMGKQHSEPVDHFGGEQGFHLLRQRDEKKRELCERHGVGLIYVRHDEDVGRKADEIVQTVQQKRERNVVEGEKPAMAKGENKIVKREVVP
jgi:hypothetical protein